MAEFRIVVIVDPSRAATGTRRVRAELQQTENAADRLRRTLARAFAFVGIAAGVQQLITLSDTFITIQNRLRTVTEDTNQLVLVTQQLFDVANRTRTSFQLTAELYTRIALSARQLGVAQADLVAITESVNQAIILSGAGAQEASAGLIQLSQGLASGTLRGDELRSVLEQLPVVADVIAEELGVTRGELRQLGFEGAITADIIINAFRNAEEDLRTRFGRTVPTIAQSFVILRNNLVALIGDFNNSSAAIEILSNLIIFVADNLDTLVRIIVAVGLAFAVSLVQRGINIAIAAIQAFTFSVANLIAVIQTGLLLVLPLAIALLVTFSDQIMLGTDDITTLRDVGVAAFQLLVESIAVFVDALASIFGTDFVTGFTDSISEIEFSLIGLLRFIATANDTIIGTLLGLGAGIAAAFAQIAQNIQTSFLRTLETARLGTIEFLREVEAVANAPTAFLARSIRESLEQISIDVPDRANTIGGAISEAFFGTLEDVNFTADALDAILERAEIIAEDRVARQEAQDALLRAAQGELETAGPARVRPGDDDFPELLQRLEDERELLQFGNQEREIQEGLLDAERSLKRDLTSVEQSRVEELLRSTQALTDQRNILDGLQAPLENYQRGIAAINQLLATGQITTQQYLEAQRDLRIESLQTATDFDSGLERALLGLQRELDNTALAVERTVVDGFRAAEDAIADFAVGAGTSFSEFVDAITRELARLAAQQLIIQPLLGTLTGFLGFGAGAPAAGVGFGPSVGLGGGGFPAPGLTPFQQGGIVGSPTFFDPRVGLGVAGEAGPEAILPLRRDSSGQLGVNATGATNQINNINVNVQVTGREGENDEDFARRIGEETQRAVKAAVVDEIRNQQRVGGVLNRGRTV